MLNQRRMVDEIEAVIYGTPAALAASPSIAAFYPTQRCAVTRARPLEAGCCGPGVRRGRAPSRVSHLRRGRPRRCGGGVAELSHCPFAHARRRVLGYPDLSQYGEACFGWRHAPIGPGRLLRDEPPEVAPPEIATGGGVRST